MRGRGLKRIIAIMPNSQPMSPPMRGRGLKQMLIHESPAVTSVAPHAGAWIETGIMSSLSGDVLCRPPCGGVD